VAGDHWFQQVFIHSILSVFVPRPPELRMYVRVIRRILLLMGYIYLGDEKKLQGVKGWTERIRARGTQRSSIFPFCLISSTIIKMKHMSHGENEHYGENKH